MPIAHVHPEVEFNLLLDGGARYWMAQGRLELHRLRLVAFWGGYPHRLISRTPLDMIGLTVPLPVLGGSPAVGAVVASLLNGGVLSGDIDDDPHDERLMRRWCSDLAPGRRDSRRTEACLLELRGRLARWASDLDTGAERRATNATAAQRLFTVVARRYAEHVSVATIAVEADVHPTYAAKIFTDAFGLPIWRYVERLRIARAQAGLKTTTWTVERIAHDCGYATRSSFNRAFTRVVGAPPSQYRASPDVPVHGNVVADRVR